MRLWLQVILIEWARNDYLRGSVVGETGSGGVGFLITGL